MFGVGTLKSYTLTACDSRTPDFVSHVSTKTYGFLVVTTRRKPKSSKRLRRGGVFSLSGCRARSSRFPPQTWARGVEIAGQGSGLSRGPPEKAHRWVVV